MEKDDLTMLRLQGNESSIEGLDDLMRAERSMSDVGDAMKSEASKAERSAKRASVVAGDFIKAENVEEELHEHPEQTATARLHAFATWVVGNYYVGNLMAFVVLVDAACTWVDIDARAVQKETPPFFAFFSDCSLALYTVEVVLLFIAKGIVDVVKDWMALLDVTIVVCGYVEVLMNSLAPADVVARLSVMRALRLARIFRLLRLFRRIRSLRELQKLVTMMATCLRTLVWSFLLCFVIMTIWAMLIVEVVYPIIEEMASNSHPEIVNCEYCQIATRSVIEANLLLFKTVIAGDSWGEVAVPVIQQNPETAFIFVGSSLSLVFGVLNIIVAVVVDTFAEARQNDILNLAEEMEEDIEKDRLALQKLFSRIDKDGSGQLSLDELIQGARRDAVFQSRLRVMDIDENDLQQLFSMIDVDNSGTIEVSEFIGPLSRWVHDSKTAPRFIKYNMLQTMQLQEDLYNLSKHYFSHLSERIDVLAAGMSVMRAEASPSSRQSSFQNSQSLPITRFFQQVTETDAEENSVEQPHSSRRPETLQLPYSSPAPSPSEIATFDALRIGDAAPGGQLDGMNLMPLLDAVVMKVELGMLEMEGRLKRTFAGLPPDSVPEQKQKVNLTSSQDMKAFRRDDLFRSVYGEPSPDRRRSRKVATSGMAQAQLAFAEGVPRRKPGDEPGPPSSMTSAG